MKNKLVFAFNDLISSLKKYKLWLYLGWSDIKLRYKGSVLGPFWITLSMSIFIITIGIVYSHLLKEPLQTYVPYLTSGLVIWSFISSTLIESNEIFHNSKNFINYIRLPYLIFMYRLLWRNIIIFFHNFLVYLLVMLYFKIPFNYHLIYFIPGFLLLSITLLFTGLLIALIGTRFRDIPPVINSIIQIVFFVSPIAWMSKTLDVDTLLIKLNPLTYFLDIVRSPLLGQAPHEISWLICLAVSLCTMIIATPIFALNRSRIPFWL